MSLKQAAAMEGKIVALCHYPPVNEKGNETKVSALLEKYRVHTAVYGHIHGLYANVFNGRSGEIQYYCVSCDQTDFKLIELQL